jgi:hypothetical protein
LGDITERGSGRDELGIGYALSFLKYSLFLESIYLVEPRD